MSRKEVTLGNFPRMEIGNNAKTDKSNMSQKIETDKHKENPVVSKVQSAGKDTNSKEYNFG